MTCHPTVGFEDLHTTHVLRYKKVSNTNQYNSKATRLAAYNAHKGDEAEKEDLDPPHDH